jgi:MFS superfamily sulfate permease-like transporter
MKSPLLPGVRTLASYRVEWLRRDVVAGLVLTTLLVPQGMAYAELAGLPAITGLYTTILCLIGYAVFGPSRVLVLGPDASLGPMIAATLLPILGSDGSPERAIALASMLALIVGALMLAAGIAKLGFVADLLSKPTQIGYVNGLALTILIGQLPKLFGFSTDANGLINEAHAFVHGLASGKAVPAAVAVGVLSLALILVLARWLPRVPGVLAAVVVAIAVSAALDLGSHDVSLVGALPKGFPPLTVPSPISDLPLLVAGALGIVLVALADTISTASAFAARTGQEVDGNGEMIGIGAANVAAGFFQGFRSARPRRGSADCADARAGARAAEEPPQPDTRRRRDRRVAVARGHSRNRAPVASASGRVPALDHGVSRSGAARSTTGRRGRGRAFDPERVQAGMGALSDDARARPRDARPARPPAVPRGRAASWSRDLPI